MRASEARKASYCLASFLTSFLFLLSFFKSSTDLVLKVDLLRAVDVGGIGENADGHAGAGDMGSLAFVGRVGAAAEWEERNEKTYLTVPEKRLSRWGS